MWLKHDSRDLFYRNPYGAVIAGTRVKLRLDVWDEVPASVVLIVWTEGRTERRISCTCKDAGDHKTYEASFSTKVLGPSWYVFEIANSEGVVFYYGPREGCTGGEGLTYGNIGPSYQITVYHDRKIRPLWYEKSLVYQIFPDRFYRGEDWKQRTKNSMAQKRKAGKRALVKKWETPSTYERDENNVIQSWQFWGGTLKGIQEKLPYIKDMGFSAIYLNPIFEAFSNHRYDTADYLKIDPMLGDDASFRELCAVAKKQGISIILDGVFNHAGSDSRYFNRFGTYETPGAYTSKRSRYRDWFLINDDNSYESWWGIGDLPAWNKDNGEYQNFIYGKGGVIEHWLQLGARGWRLDVADELTDSFIQGIRTAEDRVKTDALLLGEVWEDASHKVAYGSLRKYLCGYELDSVMNYPFREALLGFLRGDCSAAGLAERMESLKENYPPHAFYECLNLLGSHDRERLITYLVGPNKEELTDEERKNYRIPDDKIHEARAKIWLAVLIQMLTPGVPSVYYGDEVGMQGYTDPYNRGPYPWKNPDEAIRTSYRTAIQLRRMFDLATSGDFEPFFFGEDVYGFWRLPQAGKDTKEVKRRGDSKHGSKIVARQRAGGDEGDTLGQGTGEIPEGSNSDYPSEALCVVVNRSPYEGKEIRIPRRGEAADELLHNSGFQLTDSKCIVSLPQLGSSVIYFHNSKTFNKTIEPGAGIVAHITSLPATWPDSCTDFSGNGCVEEQERKVAGISEIDGACKDAASRNVAANVVADVAAHNSASKKSAPSRRKAAPKKGAKPKGSSTRKLGNFGPAAYRFIDFLERTGTTYWQVLPLHPTDAYDSPYAGLSALAGNTDLLYLQGYTLEELFTQWKKGTLSTVLSKEESLHAKAHGVEPIMYTVWREATKANFRAFKQKSDSWLKSYATFMSIRDSQIKSARRKLAQLTPGKRKHFKNPEAIVWQEWPKKYRTYSEDLYKDAKLKTRIEFYEFSQFLFDIQWNALHIYAHKHGIKIIGDLPMYVSEDSADTWSHPKNFNLDERGYKTEEAGVPPDSFAPKGQLWGNPTYDWDHLERHDFYWWMERLRREFALYDWVRLDHFVGFQNYFQIPAGKQPKDGRWLLGPGAALFKRAYEEFGPLPFIAEDLGTVTPSVRGLLSQCGFVGMDVAEFYNGDLRTWYDSVFNKISYTSTHDTDTLLGWAMQTFNMSHKDEAKEVVLQMIDRVLQSAADVVMVPLQDVLGLGSEARMNKPGTARGNWKWQAQAQEIEAKQSEWAYRLHECNRFR